MNPLALILLLLAEAGPILEVSPPLCELGVVDPGAGVVEQTLELANRSERALRVTLVSTCDCLTASPASFSLPEGAAQEVRIRFDPADELGPFEKDLIVRTDHPQLPKALYLVRGEVRGDAEAAAEGGAGRGAEGPAEAPGADADRPPDSALRRAIGVDYYYSPGCRSCQAFLRRTVPRLERRLQVALQVREHNILDPEEYASYLAQLEELEAQERAFPALVVGGTVLQGEREIDEKLPGVLEAETGPAGAVQDSPRGAVEDGAAASRREGLEARLAALPVLAAGLLDGINPCAFTTLIFLISALAVAGRSRKEVLGIGLFFTLAVFGTYLAVGLGFFQAIRMAAVFPLVARLIRWAVVAALLVFAALSLYDFFLIRKGRTDRVVLQLPRAIKRRLHRDIKRSARSAALITTSLVLGFLVSIFELACTGQVYFPTIVYVLRVRGNAAALPFLLLYNFGFVVPLLVVFALAYWGVSSQAVSAVFQRSAGFVKLALAGLFVGLALLTILS